MKDMRWQERYKSSNSRNCGNKRAFPSFVEASIFNKHSLRFISGSHRREKMRVYRCNSCRQWHIGHQPRRDEKLNRERYERNNDERI